MMFTVGSKPTSHGGNACCSLDRQYGMQTVGSIDWSSSSILLRYTRCHGRNRGFPCGWCAALAWMSTRGPSSPSAFA